MILMDKLVTHASEDLEFLAGAVSKVIEKDFVITEEYLLALNKEQLISLAKEIKLDKALVAAGRDAKSMFNVKKDVMVAYFTGGTINLKGIVPKEMAAFTGKKANRR